MSLLSVKIHILIRVYLIITILIITTIVIGVVFYTSCDGSAYLLHIIEMTRPRM